MKSYPSIDKLIQGSYPVYAFDKLDGSNIRAEWTPKRGFDKFGTRKRLLDPNEEPLGEAVRLILEDSEELERRLRTLRAQRVTCFFEFFGDNSFAGNHEDEDHRVVLFDIDVYKKGLMPPKDFIKFTKGLAVPELVHHGNANTDFVLGVQNGTIPGVTFEGVVCKSATPKGLVKMFKIKSRAWIDRLKNKCGDDEALFNRLL